MSRRTMIGGAACCITLLALIPLGRWERDHAVNAQRHGIEQVHALVGGIASPRLDAYRSDSQVSCLLYWAGGNPYALEECFDSQGRLVEANDRRSGENHVHFWSVLWQPEAAPFRVDPAVVARLQAAVLKTATAGG